MRGYDSNKKIFEINFFFKNEEFSRADFWNRANGFAIYLINEDTAPKTAREPLLGEARTFKSKLTKIRYVEL